MGSPTIFSGKYTKLLTQKGLLQQGGAVNQFDGPRNYIANSSLESGTLDGWNRVKTTITSNLPSGVPTIGKLISVAPSITAFSAFSGTAPFDTYGLRFGNILSTVVAGEGIISDAFTVEPGDLGKVLTFKLYYKSDLGASTDNWSGVLGSQTWAVYIYDQTAGAWLQPAGFLGMNQNSGVGIVSGTFQSSVVSGQQYRIAVIALKNTTSTSALQIDNIYVGSQTAPIGPVVTDWRSYDGSFYEGTTNNRNSEMSLRKTFWRRVGDYLEVEFSAQRNGSASIGGSTAFYLTLPPGLVIDQTNMTDSNNGIFFNSNSTTFQGTFQAGAFIGSSQSAWFISQVGAVQHVYNNTNFPPNLFFGGQIRFKIQGWSSNVQLSNDTDTRVVAFYANTSASPVPVGVMNFSAVYTDTHGGYQGSGVYRIPVSGLYVISVNGFKSNSVTSDAFLRINGIDVNLMTTTTSTNNGTGQHIVSLKAGDTVSIYNNSAQWTPAVASWVTFEIQRLSGPSVVAASETVAMSAYNVSGQSILNAANTAVTNWTKQFDSHSMFNASSGILTIPVSGKYQISFTVNFSVFTINAGICGANISQSGSSNYFAVNVLPFPNQPVEFSVPVMHQFSCQAGDTFTFFAFQNNGTARLLNAGDFSRVRISVLRVGN